MSDTRESVRIVREIAQVKSAQIEERLKAKMLKQLHERLRAIVDVEDAASGVAPLPKK